MKLTPEMKVKLYRSVCAFLAQHEADLANPKVGPRSAAIRAAALWEAIPAVLRSRLDVAGVHAIYETLRRGCPEQIGRIYALARDPAYRRKAQLFWEYLRPREETLSEEEDLREAPEVDDVRPTRAGAPRYAAAAKAGGVPEEIVIPKDPMARERVRLRDKSGAKPEDSVLPADNSPAGQVGEFIMPEDEGDLVQPADADEMAAFDGEDLADDQDDFPREG